MGAFVSDVRFTPESGHSARHHHLVLALETYWFPKRTSLGGNNAHKSSPVLGHNRRTNAGWVSGRLRAEAKV